MPNQNVFNQLQGALAPSIEVAGKSYLYFGGTAYLGIPNNEAFLRNYVRGLEQFGLNNGSSRNNNIQLGIYNEAEKHLAKKFGAEAALLSSSGYLAAQLVVKNLRNWGQICYAPACHPALWLDQEPQTTGTFSAWAETIVDTINRSKQEQWVLISNSMNNLFPEIYDFSFVKQISSSKRVLLIVDDSHGLGLNNKGLGAFSALPVANHIETVVVASMAKALGVDAGLVLGAEKIISKLKQSNEFLGASPPAAAGLFALMQADEIYETELNKLQHLTKRMATALAGKKGWHFIPEFPVFFCKNAELSQQLLAKNILISSFPYPDKDGEIINRIVLSSWHSETAIEELINAL
ncbi:aminotransferase class I/II-fold pyridoxal phosphate-dependent enzyme [Pedobacter sp. KR3-3]|uniref:Aminotransferase class I/II-fold pyridoxal phosphate-dependent enzyme n=1 Tax=Pedobacter albus TaxID=3113905 RepID=A0ABU7IAG5_9SPHI|nr:aminotransferase class I/II-fold pyridoxal phosphate-dependent enzyme [Pedobacter sp. KR3-3]MEE1946469.1 aminotransferase class I/II-fold pyridoxal phosphate-dependent enzyme [Pedobacter sp. KR3-3]